MVEKPAEEEEDVEEEEEESAANAPREAANGRQQGNDST